MLSNKWISHNRTSHTIKHAQLTPIHWYLSSSHCPLKRFVWRSCWVVCSHPTFHTERKIITHATWRHNRRNWPSRHLQMWQWRCLMSGATDIRTLSKAALLRLLPCVGVSVSFTTLERLIWRDALPNILGSESSVERIFIPIERPVAVTLLTNTTPSYVNPLKHIVHAESLSTLYYSLRHSSRWRACWSCNSLVWILGYLCGCLSTPHQYIFVYLLHSIKHTLTWPLWPAP